MRINGSALAGLAYFDRLTEMKLLTFSPPVQSPHVQTERIDYTVPDGVKFYAEFIRVEIRRTTVALPGGVARVLISYTPVDGTPTEIVRVELQDNVAGAIAVETLPNLGVMNTGDEIQVYTADSSTDGTVGYYLYIKGYEFA